VSEENVEVIRRANAAFNSVDNEAMLALFDPEIEFVDHLPLPDIAEAGRGTDEMSAAIAAWREGFVGFQADVEEYVDLGDFVVAVTRWHFVSRDENVKLDWRGAEAYEIRQGRMVWAEMGFRDRQAAIDAVEQRRRVG
jgi:ketosteroid isomerase-like protein